MIAPPESFWPSSVVGMLTSAAVVITTATFFYDRLTGRGKSMQSIANDLKDLDSRVTDIENTDKIIDQTLRSMRDTLKDIDHELRGVDGNNGIKSAVKSVRVEIEKIHERNRQMDLLAERFKQVIRHYDGPERRKEFRGLREMLNEEEE